MMYVYATNSPNCITPIRTDYQPVLVRLHLHVD
jgi:hypothetical protein